MSSNNWLGHILWVYILKKYCKHMIMNLHISLVITIYMGVYIYNIKYKSNIETKTLNTNEKLNLAVMRNQWIPEKYK